MRWPFEEVLEFQWTRVGLSSKKGLILFHFLEATVQAEFEFDPAKSQVNKAKHGIDFEEAKALWDTEKLSKPTQSPPWGNGARFA